MTNWPSRCLATLSLLVLCGISATAKPDSIAQNFSSPPDTARPWVYWYFMDGNQTEVGMKADLEAMKSAGIGGAIMLDVNIGVPKGPVDFMGDQWQKDFVFAVTEAKSLGLQIAMPAGPGWCGAGGPWITPDKSMQDLVASETSAEGPSNFDGVLSRPQPRTPFFGMGTLTDSMKQQWSNYYVDEYVIAFPTPSGNAKIDNSDYKALYYRSSVSSMGAPPRIPSPVNGISVPQDQCIPTDKIIDLTGKMGPDGHLNWDVPGGHWTIMRFGRTITGQTTRPAPDAGLGFETDKFSKEALDLQFKNFEDVLFQKLGPNYRSGDTGLTDLHFDSWEMASQNWSEKFRQEFLTANGYDLLPCLPALTGQIVGSEEQSERFLWDLRHTASDLLVENQADYLAQYAHKHNLSFSVEPYDLNPSADLDLGSSADIPMGEFWSKSWANPSDFSCIEATSVGHTNGKKVIGAESFTSNPGEDWHQYPGSMKEQLDWALADGINKFVIHRYQHQPYLDRFPGMTMGPYGVHWERTQTWWSMVPAFHKYISRCSYLLRQGLPVADILYITPEGAPEVFTPPPSALVYNDEFPDRREYNFDGCSPENLIKSATVRNGRTVFPDGMSYRIIVLPEWNTMTPGLLSKIIALVRAGATVQGAPPVKSPSLDGYPKCDHDVRSLSSELWGEAPYPHVRKVGLGYIVYAAPSANVSVDDSSWIWYDEGEPQNSAPVGRRFFKTTWTIPEGSKIASAVAAITADNDFNFSINGVSIGGGDDFHKATVFNISNALKTGANSIEVAADNTGDSPNPAGLIATFSAQLANGSSIVFRTGQDWNSSTSAVGPWEPVKVLGPASMGPWGTPGASTSIYPEFQDTAKSLKSMNVAPDFTSGASLRYTHRVIDDTDLYFVGNASKAAVYTQGVFRSSGHQPEWWNPETGVIRPLPNFTSANGQTRIPLALGVGESGFVVFRGPAAPASHTAKNFPSYKSVETLAGPWQVSFDPHWGGPADPVTFNTLDDWSTRPEDGIKYYSGKAGYTAEFSLPAGAKPSNGKYSISLGDVKDLATVTLNGYDLGITWCSPWRLEIPVGDLKSAGNTLKITVANLWINRLIGDAGKPQAQRLTWTTGEFYSPASPLQPSGLLGPVTIERKI